MLAAAGGSFVVSVVIARSLGVQEMGVYSFIVWVAGTIASLSSLGLPDAISKYVAEQKGIGNGSLAAIIARRIVGMQVLAAASGAVIAAVIWGSIERHQWVLILLALATVMPATVQQTLLALMEGQQRFDLQVLTTVGGLLFQIGIVALVAHRWASISGFLLANFMSSAVLLGITYFFSRSMLASSPRTGPKVYSAELSKKVLTYSLSIYGLWLLNLIVFDKTEMLFLRVFKSPEQLAFYGIAFALTARLGTAGDSVSYVLFPMFVTRFAETGTDGLRASYRRSISYLQMLMVPICLWAIPTLPAIIVFAYGHKYARVVPVIQILLITMVFSVTMNVSSNVLYAMDSQLSLLRYMVVVAILNIILDLALIPRYAAIGAAVANGISQAVAAAGLIVILRNLLPGSFPGRASVKIYLAALVSTAPIAYVGLSLDAAGFPLALSVLLAAVLYVLCLAGLRVLTKAELDVLRTNFATFRTRRAG